MRLIALALFAFVCAPLPGLASEPSAAPWTEDGPPCFAYSKAERRFACTALWAEPNNDSEEGDVSSETIGDSLEVAKARDAQIIQGVVIVQPSADPDEPKDEWFVTAAVHPQAVYDLTLIPIDEVRELLSQRGFDSKGLETALLPEDTWVAVGDSGRRLRFTLHLHEGDASFEYTGHLEVQCDKDGPGWPVFAQHDLGGPLAAVSWAEPDVVVVTIEVHDGGEGWVESHREHWHLDLAAFCEARLGSSTR